MDTLKNGSVNNSDEYDILKVEDTVHDGLYLTTYSNGVEVEQELSPYEVDFIRERISGAGTGEVDSRVDEELRDRSEKEKGSRLTTGLESGANGLKSATKFEEPRGRTGSVSWKPSSLLTIPKVPGKKRRWVNSNINGRTEKMIEENWRFVQTSELPAATIADGKLTDGNVQRRELVLMEMSDEMHSARDEYFQDIRRSGSQLIAAHNQRMGSIGGVNLGYGKVEVES